MQKITFENLPFRATSHQVIFFESGFHPAVNDFITRNLDTLRQQFAQMGLEFHYLPTLTQDPTIVQKVLYHAPYLTQKILAHTPIKSSSLSNFMTNAAPQTVPPSLLWYAKNDRSRNRVTFHLTPLDGVDSVEGLVKVFRDDVLRYREEKRRKENNHLLQHFSPPQNHGARPMPEDANVRMPNPVGAPPMPLPVAAECMAAEGTPAPKAQPQLQATPKKKSFFKKLTQVFEAHHQLAAEEECAAPAPTLEEISEERMSIQETQRLLAELQANVQRLRLEGVSLMAIHEFIDKQEPLSRMVITEDYRILLPEYNGMEIEMGALPKAIYFLFLRYPKGIVCKHMPDYYNELLGIYRQLRPNTDEARLNLTVTKVVNPLGNALNENIARIRKAFVEKFDEHLAANYIVTGERGQQYAVPLDRDLISWEE